MFTLKKNQRMAFALVLWFSQAGLATALPFRNLTVVPSFDYHIASSMRRHPDKAVEL